MPAQFHPEHYAALHGYTNMSIDSLEGESKNLQSLRATVGPKPEDWMSSRLSALYLKVSLLRIHLPRFDYVVWMDLDVYIIDLERPLSTFTGVMEQFGFSVRVCGEEFTRGSRHDTNSPTSCTSFATTLQDDFLLTLTWLTLPLHAPPVRRHWAD